MPTLRKYKPQSEQELHIIIARELDALEAGLELLRHEYISGKGVLDFLCVDSGGRLVIIEVKLHEDENILFQALRYYSDIDRDRYLIATVFAGKAIDPEQNPRVVLIAERFSEDIRRLSTLVVPEIELLEYTVLVEPRGSKGICYHPVSLPVVTTPPSEPKTIDDLVQYLTNEELKPILANMRDDIKNIGEGIEEYPTQSYIGYKHTSGRQFAYIRIFRKSVEFGAHIIDENKQLLDYEGIRVETGSEDYAEVLEKSKASFINLGGEVKT
jgi:hypothetical protein